MIQVGINENVILKSVSQEEEKRYLRLTFDLAAEKLDDDAVFDSMNSAKVEDVGTTSLTINMFPFKWPSGPSQDTKTVDERVTMVSDDIKKLRIQLNQLLGMYLTEDKIVWDFFKGTGIDSKNWRAAYQDNDSLMKVFNNLSQQFIEMVTPFLDKKEYALRLKLIRQSATKHFPTIPSRYIAENPYVELMDVPKESSKVKFSAWELQMKLNDPTPSAKPADATPEGLPEGKSVFGQRE